jgi:hypothetical protein
VLNNQTLLIMTTTQPSPTIISLDNIAALLKNQHLFDVTILPELLYDTMVDELSKLNNVDVICTRADMKAAYLRKNNPDKIVNGKYLKYCYYDTIVMIINKFN